MILTTVTLAVIWYYAMQSLAASKRRAKLYAQRRAMAPWHESIRLERVLIELPENPAPLTYEPIPTLPPSYVQTRWDITIQ